MIFEESNLQINCFKYFRYQYPHLAKLFFAIPNGGRRNAREAARMKAEGVTAGVADAILLAPSSNGEYNSLCIEFKTEKGRQSDAQKEFQKDAESQGNKYDIVRNFDDFVFCIKNYLSL